MSAGRYSEVGVAFTPGWYRHKEGGAVVAYSMSVHELTGEALVHYYSVAFGSRRTRSLRVFEAEFRWWRVASRDELFAAACGGEDEVRRVFGGAFR